MFYILDYGFMMVIKFFFNYVYLIFYNYLLQVFDENVWEIVKRRSFFNFYVIYVD